MIALANFHRGASLAALLLLLMPHYVDGFVLPVKKSKLAAYRKIAANAGPIFKEHGALAYIECAGDDLKVPGMPMNFIKLTNLKAGETVVFSYVVYRSKAQRDRANKKIMADPRMHEIMDPKHPVFDVTRMAYGGFQAIVEL